MNELQKLFWKITHETLSKEEFIIISSLDA